MDKNVLSLVKFSIVKILACGADCLTMYKYYNLESLSDIQTSLFGRIFFIWSDLNLLSLLSIHNQQAEYYFPSGQDCLSPHVSPHSLWG